MPRKPKEAAPTQLDRIEAAVLRNIRSAAANRAASEARFARIESALERTTDRLDRMSDRMDQMAAEQARQWKLIGAAIESLAQSTARNEAAIRELRDTVTQVVREWQAYLRRLPPQ